MDKDTIDYIFNYYLGLMTEKESIAYRHLMSTEKLIAYNHDINDDDNSRVKIYKEKNWLTSDKEALELLKEGSTSFKENVSKRLFTEHRKDIFLNYCPVCGQLARTPKAKQCRQGHTW
ncbi:MAG: hypothetical protein JNM51_16605 [Bacteroidia bacterium]|nr:hypothetical protein [Bacteroidia bacterium]